MKKLFLIIVVVVALGVLWLMGAYNSLVSGRAGVDRAWSDVEVQYQRRNDLVPQLVSTVQWAANFEKKTLTDVVEARAKATQIQVNPTNAQSLAQFSAAQGELSGALSRLLVSVEAYPQLTATKGFQDLQSQLEGTENRIGVARGDFNAVAAQWNIMITQFPRVVIARFFGFEKAVLFDAQTGSDVAPKIEFDIK